MKADKQINRTQMTQIVMINMDKNMKSLMFSHR